MLSQSQVIYGHLDRFSLIAVGETVYNDLLTWNCKHIYCQRSNSDEVGRN